MGASVSVLRKSSARRLKTGVKRARAASCELNGRRERRAGSTASTCSPFEESTKPRRSAESYTFGRAGLQRNASQKPVLAKH